MQAATHPALAPLVELVLSASASRTPLRVRGGDTKAFHGPATHDLAAGAAVLDTRDLSGVVAYEPTELVITALAGTPLAEIEAQLAERGQCLPFEPPHFGPGATLGGMVAAGLSGPARASVGAVRDYMLGVQLLNGRGELLTYGGQVMKNVAGYDVSRLMAGSWGTLGLLVEVSLKVLPVAPAEATLVFELPQAQALAQLQRWGGQPLPLNASCWVHDNTASPPKDLLFVRLRGAVAAVESACTRMLKDVPGQRMDNAQAGPDWADCRDQRLPFFTPPAPELALWRLSVAPAAPALDLPWAQLIEWHGGQRWLWAPLDAAQRLRAATASAGGHATLFRAPASGLPADFSRRSPAAGPLATIEQRLRASFDPAGIFNPGRLG
jgi:glycolate oxidase FAD binding subunit